MTSERKQGKAREIGQVESTKKGERKDDVGSATPWKEVNSIDLLENPLTAEHPTPSTAEWMRTDGAALRTLGGIVGERFASRCNLLSSRRGSVMPPMLGVELQSEDFRQLRSTKITFGHFCEKYLTFS